MGVEEETKSCKIAATHWNNPQAPSKGDHMKFRPTTKIAARLRQDGRCAMCGEDLADLWEEAHHIHPHGLGGPDETNNCVILCYVCHGRVHYNGRFRSGIVAQITDFPYMNG